MTVAIIDYDVGNLKNVETALSIGGISKEEKTCTQDDITSIGIYFAYTGAFGSGLLFLFVPVIRCFVCISNTCPFICLSLD